MAIITNVEVAGFSVDLEALKKDTVRLRSVMKSRKLLWKYLTKF